MYKPFLIANFSNGLDQSVEPWLLPNDAFHTMLDSYVYRGVINKRDGYSGFARGKASTYTESRMVKEVTGATPATGAINSSNQTYTFTLTAPVARGRLSIVGSNPAQTVTDDGEGALSGDGTGTINYTTGAVSVTFTAAPITSSTVLATYSYHQALPVMGVMNFYTASNVRELIVVDTKYVNKYNASTDRLDDISSSTAYTGGATDFFSWVNYEDNNSNARLLFCNGVNGDVIQIYNGSTVAAYAPTFSTGTLNARQIFNIRDRLVLFQTIEAGTVYPRRIRISGIGATGDSFDATTSGAGFIDIPDNTWFYGAAYSRDDILFFTEGSVWILKYTGNDLTPFTLEKIDSSRGSGAAFSVISYLNRTIAASPRGLIVSDGYKVERMDDKIPDYTYNDINNDGFERCFSGFLDEERDVYIIHPSQGVVKPSLLTVGESDRILVINFEEDNYSIYRLPLSCMGKFETSLALTWADLTAANGYPDWDSMSNVFSKWKSFPFSKKVPISIGGGHKGEIWRLNDSQSQDNPQKIRAITIVDSRTLRVETDYNNYDIGDYLSFESVEGMTDVNSKQAAIKSISTANRIVDVEIDTNGFSTYTTGGIASKNVEMDIITKKLNPYVDQDKKIRIGYCYLYISIENTALEEGGIAVDPYIDIEVITGNNNSPDVSSKKYQVNCSNLSGNTQSKRWVKIWINQTSTFLQLRIRNNQAGFSTKIHGIMPGIEPVGELV